MINYISLFEKFIGIIDWNLLTKYAFKLGIDAKTRNFFTHQHLATMIYFHICEHESLRALSQGMAEQMKDLLPEISLSTLSNHNNNRDYRVFLPIMDQLITLCLRTLTKDQRLTKFGSVKMIDSTTVSMCLKFFDWAKFRSTKAGIKMHTSIDGATSIPVTKCIDDESLLSNNITILFDKKVRLGNVYQNLTKCTYRIIGISDETGKKLTFVTNLMKYNSEEIAWLYKKRWDIELFFKWIKQHCKIKNLLLKIISSNKQYSNLLFNTC